MGSGHYSYFGLNLERRPCQELKMLKKIIASGLILATVAGASLATTAPAEAYWHHGGGWGHGGGWHHGGGWGRGGAIAGGVAAGLLGGVLLGGALANQDRYYDEGPVYYDAPPAYYPQRCHIERRRIANQYDAGSHLENVRVCY
jgi:hypothetical protein